MSACCAILAGIQPSGSELCFQGKSAAALVCLCWESSTRPVSWANEAWTRPIPVSAHLSSLGAPSSHHDPRPEQNPRPGRRRCNVSRPRPSAASLVSPCARCLSREGQHPRNPSMASPPKDDSPFGVHSQDSAVHIVSDASHLQSSAPGPPGPHHAQQGHADEYGDDEYDSGFDSGSLLGDETDTLASSILNYRIENGRQYHAYRDGAYWGPNDEQAKELLDFAHHMYLLTLDHRLFLAPIKDPQVRMLTHDLTHAYGH